MKRQVRHFLWACWYRGWAVVAGIIILLALFFSLARVVLPLAPGYKQEIETLAGQLIDQPVAVGRISTDWKWFRPRLKLLDLEVESDRGDEPLHIEQVVLGVNLLKSLIDWEVAVDDITVVGTHISVRRDDGGRWSVQDMPLAGRWGGGQTAWTIPPALEGRTLRLVGGVIDYTDAILDIDHRLHSVDAAVTLHSGAPAVYVDAGLPPELGRRLEFALELDGDLSRPETLDGRLYIRGGDLELATWAGRLGVAERVRDGRLSVSMWLGLGERRRYEAVGRLSAENLLFELPGGQRWSAEALSGEGRLQIDRETIALDLAGLEVLRNGRMWQPAGVSFRTAREREHRYRRGAFAGSFLRLEDIGAWMRSNGQLREALAQWNIDGVRGDLSRFTGQWDLTGERPEVSVKADFENAGFAGHGKTPSLSGLAGVLRVQYPAVELELQTDSLIFDYPFLFRQPLPEAVVNGRVQIRGQSGGWTIATRDLWIDTPHAQTRHWMDLRLRPDEGPHIDAFGLAGASDAAAAPRYIPAGITDPELLKWLDNAFVAGVARNGEYELRGPLKQFPFREGGGVFRVEFDAEGNSLNFWPPGPIAENIRGRARFEGNGLWIDVHELDILDSTVHNVAVKIEDFDNAPIELQADLYGSMQDVVQYIRTSPLRKPFDAVADQLAAHGRHASDLRLIIPLGDDSGPVRYRVAGAVYEAGVRLDRWGLRFDGIQTRLRITDESVDSPPFEGRLNDQPVTLQFDTGGASKSGRRFISTRLDGRLQLGELLGTGQVPFADRFSGTSQWNAVLQYGLAPPSDDGLRLSVYSDLDGTAVDFPAPLHKPKSGEAPLQIDATVDNGIIDADIAWDDWLYGALRFTPDDGVVELSHADIRADAGIPTLSDKPGIKLTGRVPELNIDDWRRVYQSYQGVPGVLEHLESVKLQAGRLTFLHRTADDLGVEFSQQPHNWKVRLSSPDIRGELLVPKQGFSNRGLAINMDYVDFDRLGGGPIQQLPDPAEVPPFQLAVGELKLNNWDLRRVNMLAEPAGDSLNIHSMRILDPAVGLEGEGRWRMDDDGNHQTRMQLHFRSEDAGVGMSRFGFAEMIKGGAGGANFNLHWPAAPSNFSLDILDGDVRISFDDGQILDIEPGGGRIFGLLSLQTIPRRLSLDFTDLFGKGFRFDTMRGSFRLVNGNAYTDDYYIDGPAGRIDVRGRIGLAQRDYDQTVIFRPDLSSSLPLVGALVGGATGGWTVIVVDRIARLFGKQVDDLARVEYSLTGDWEDPVMKPVTQ